MFFYIAFPTSNVLGVKFEIRLREEIIRSGAEMLSLVSIITSNKVGVINPWPKTKAFMVSDQKYEADISIGSFLVISDKDRVRH